MNMLLKKLWLESPDKYVYYYADGYYYYTIKILNNQLIIYRLRNNKFVQSWETWQLVKFIPKQGLLWRDGDGEVLDTIAFSLKRNTYEFID